MCTNKAKCFPEHAGDVAGPACSYLIEFDEELSKLLLIR